MMGRDQTRVLIGAVASLALIAAGALGMDWYELTLDGLTATDRIAIDLQRIHVCGPDHACLSRPLTLLSGMFPTLAAVTLWSSMGFAALVALQAGARLLTGTAHDAFTKLGYMLSLMAISLAVATAYLFGPEPEGVTLALVSRVVISLHRTWAPLTMIVGLAAGFVAIYLAVARESSDPAAAYKPVTIASDSRDGRIRSPSIPVPVVARGQTGTIPPRDQTGTVAARDQTGALRAVPPRDQTGTVGPRDQTGILRTGSPRDQTGALRAVPPRDQTGSSRAVSPREQTRTISTVPLRASVAGTDPGLSITQPGIGPISAALHARSGPLPTMPAHLRRRLQYVALTAELTGGGIDARREDGLSRLVLWRDVVGVVARRLPPEYDSAAFVDIVSTAGSTLRIVPWTRLTGERIEAEGDARPRALIEHVVARCPDARLDPATRQFLDTGQPAQLPDLDTLRAHDARLA